MPAVIKMGEPYKGAGARLHIKEEPMDATQATPAPNLVIYGRHVVGMAIVSLANPVIYYHPEPVGWWLSMWLGSLAFALACFFLYYLFFTERAKGAWPSRFFMIAWVFMGLLMLGGWSDYRGARSQASHASEQQHPPAQQQSSAQPDYEAELARLDSLRPGWREMVKSQGFSTWLSDQPSVTVEAYKSADTAALLISVLDQYNVYASTNRVSSEPVKEAGPWLEHQTTR